MRLKAKCLVLATATPPTAVENKIPDQSKYISTLEFNKLTAGNFTARLKQENLPNNGDIADFVKKIKILNKKVTSNKSKHLLVEN